MALAQSASFIAPDLFPNSVNTDRRLTGRLAGASDGFADPNSFKPTVSGRNVLLAEGDCFLKGADAADQGTYFAYNDSASEPLAMPVVKSNPFYATILLRVLDPQYGSLSGDLPGAQYKILSGSASAAPTPLDDAAVNSTVSGTWRPGPFKRIADVLINPGDTASIPLSQVLDRRKLWTPSQRLTVTTAQMNALTGMSPSTTVFNSSVGDTFVWTGSRWAQQNRKMVMETTSDTITLGSTVQNACVLQNLPIGKWLLQARARLDYSIPAGDVGRAYAIQMQSGGGSVVLDAQQHIAPAAVGRVHLFFMREVEITNATNSWVIAGSYPGTASGTQRVDNAHMWAVPVDY